MAYNFPNSPTLGQTYLIYKWDGEKWIFSIGGLSSGTTLNFPNSPAVDDVFNGYKWDGQKWILFPGGLSTGTTLDFPSSPTVGQVYRSYTWDGEKWYSTVGGVSTGPTNKMAVFATAAPTSTGNQIITCTDLGGLTPKAAIFTLSLATADKTPVAHEMIGMGACDASNQFAGTRASKDNYTSDGTTNHHQFFKTNKCAIILDNTGTILGEAQFVSFGSNSVTINWTTAPSSAYKFFVTFLAGSDLSVAVGNSLMATGGTTNTIGFQPDAIFLTSMMQAASASVVHGGDFNMGFAAWDNGGTLAKETYSTQGWQNSGLLNKSADHVTTVALAGLGGSGSINFTVLPTRASTSFTLTSSTVSSAATTQVTGYVAFKYASGRVFAGQATFPTSTGNKATTGVGFQPKAVLMMPQQNFTTNTFNSANGCDSAGFAAMAGTVLASACYALDGRSAAVGGGAPSICKSGFNGSGLYLITKTASPSTQQDATLVSLDSDGFTLNYATTTASAFLMNYLAVTYDIVPTPTWHDAFISTHNEDSSGWNGFSLRILVPASLLAFSGTKFRLTLGASSAGGCTIDGIYAGHAAGSGDAYDFDGTQVQVRVAGSASFSITTNNTVVTDENVYTFDKTKNFIVAVHFSATSAIRGRSSVAGIESYFKSTSNDTATADVSGYSPNITGTLRLVSRIEVFS